MQHGSRQSMAGMAPGFEAAQSQRGLVELFSEGDGGVRKRRRLLEDDAQHVDGGANKHDGRKREADSCLHIVESRSGSSSPTFCSPSVNSFQSSPVCNSPAYLAQSPPQDETAPRCSGHFHVSTQHTHLQTQHRDVLLSSGQCKSDRGKNVCSLRSSTCCPSSADTPPYPYTSYSTPLPYVEEPSSEDDDNSPPLANQSPRGSGSRTSVAATRQSNVTSMSALCARSGAAGGNPSLLLPRSGLEGGRNAARSLYPCPDESDLPQVGRDEITLCAMEEKSYLRRLTVGEVWSDSRCFSEEGEIKLPRVDEPSSADEDQ
uniref:Uncharacterized protein n=1 Tax=Toxoplasma gondii (strain ATCC 50861 / VEG) TaxID=432359 RepID=A0A0F7UV03_TOXGV|nr:TPA: hypothetical protein BN1205_034095 [Toxoplasma gondii VEG]